MPEKLPEPIDHPFECPRFVETGGHVWDNEKQTFLVPERWVNCLEGVLVELVLTENRVERLEGRIDAAWELLRARYPNIITLEAGLDYAASERDDYINALQAISNASHFPNFESVALQITRKALLRVPVNGIAQAAAR